MRISFDFDVDDIVAYRRYINDHSKAFGRTITIIKWIIPVVCVLVLLILGLAKGTGVAFIVTGIIYLLISVWWVIYIPKKVKENSLKKTRKAILKQKENNPGLFGNREMFFSDENVRVVTATADSTVKLSTIRSAVKTDDHYFLFISDIEAFIIPHRKINEEDNRSLNTFLQTRYGKLI